MNLETLMTDIYVIPVPDAYLIYSPLRRVSALVNQKAVSLLKKQIGRNRNSEDVPESLQSLVHELCQPVQEPPPERIGLLQPMFLGILPTRACNLACAYCDFGASMAPQEKMDFRIATAAVDWMAEHVKSLGLDTLEIHFFGGEPFFAEEVVDVVVHRARARAGRLDLTPRFEVSTNGVFDESRARFVGDYFDTVVLSFDGTQDIHDLHRPGKNGQSHFEIVKRTAELLGQSPTELCLRVCVSQANVTQLEQIVQWFCETFRASMINIETLQPTPQSQKANLKPPNPYDFAVQYVSAHRLAERCGIQTIYASAATDMLRRSFCPLGKDALIVSPDGRVSGCYLPQQEWQKRGLDLDLGWLSANGTMQLDFDAITRLRQMIMEKPRCESCFCRWTCAGGCHVKHSYPGCAPEYDDFCIQTRIITACALLAELGFDEAVEKLLTNRAAMQTLVLQASDKLIEGS
ncbi:putative radical SAM domain protein [Candidatus Vecturithrix granuli]|uniref:Putative radical SAM domain protein n=1 Tax=Vecturithrix granuli TaxID=1499967 RepID=A0A081C2W0_VECG1|nr:putative radical SAM domain protein [Candidatus Vecturithrix granuli]